MKRYLFCLRVATAALFLTTLASSLANAQQIPVEYEITWIKSGLQTRAININDDGTVVGILGQYPDVETAIAWTPQTGIVDLNTIVNVPPGWRLASARGINNQGQIAGNAEELANPGTWVAYRCNLNTGDVEIMQKIGQGIDGNTPCARRDPINENGDVAYTGYVDGVNHLFVNVLGEQDEYDILVEPGMSALAINDHRQIATSNHRISLGLTPGDPYYIDAFPSGNFVSINNSGVMAGSVSRKYRGSTDSYAATASTLVNEFGPRLTWGYGINSVGDVCGNLDGRAFLFTDEYGFTNLDLLVNGSQSAVDEWDAASAMFVEQISNPGATGFGSICGSARMPGSLDMIAFVLTPKIPGLTPGISVSPTTGLVTSEGLGADSFTIVLDTQPTADVTIDVSSLDTTEGTINGSTNNSLTLTFTTTDWFIEQTVTVTGVDDLLEDGNTPYTILTAAATSADADYTGLDADDVSVTNLDDEDSSVTMSADDPSVTEGDRKDTTPGEFTITLSAASASDVQVWYQVSNGSAGNKDYRMVDSASGLLTFAPGDLSKTVRFNVLGDTQGESNETFTIELTDAVGATISKSVGTATIIDND